MYIRVKCGSDTKIISSSKQMRIQELRKLIDEKFNIPPKKQKLFFSGKQLENGHDLLDYKINVNDVVILMECQEQSEESKEEIKVEEKKSKALNKRDLNKNLEKAIKAESVKSEYFEVGDLVDAHDPITSSWNESKIVNIVQADHGDDDGLFYHVSLDSFPNEDPVERKLCQIRPRARDILPVEKLENGVVVMLNYNMEKPAARGLWYDAEVIKYDEKKRKLVVSLLFGEKGDIKMDNINVVYVDEIYKVEGRKKISDRSEEDTEHLKNGPKVKRKYGAHCEKCEDHPRRKCNECGCRECGEKSDPNLQIMCDECDHPYHIFCLDPPLETIPEDEDWYCPECKNDDSEIVKAGEKVKQSKKRNLVSKKESGKKTRDWGQGFATAGRQRTCTIVKPDHFGPIPGVEVGQSWLLRVSCSESGVHRPPVSGIHGKEKDGAYSVVLAGGYEDDEDRGEEFTYTGSGGRDLSGNKRTAAQSFDQELTRSNRAIALNCNSKIDTVKGAEASDWKGGKPVRVIRSYKAKKHSEYAPDEGIRYDGIYKVVKYWPEKGQSGYSVWRYLFRRDDPIPAPWTEEGKERIDELGLKMVYPDGYLDYLAEKENEKSKTTETPRGQKRKQPSLPPSPQVASPKSSKNAFELMMGKRTKTSRYTVDPKIMKLISEDSVNKKTWDECLEKVPEGKSEFCGAIKKHFDCVCCCDMVRRPVTTPCGHNICKVCIKRSFEAKIYTCPVCRHLLGKEYVFSINEALEGALLALFEGYANQA